MIMSAMVAAVVVTVVTIFEPVSPTLIITVLGFLATIVISLFGLLRTEQQDAERKDRIKQSLLELVEEIGTAEGIPIETDSKESLRNGIAGLARKVFETHNGPTKPNS